MNSQFEAFKARAEAASAEVHRFAGREEALALVKDILREVGVSAVPQCGAVCAAGTFLDEAGKADLQGQGARHHVRGHKGRLSGLQSGHQRGGLAIALPRTSYLINAWSKMRAQASCTMPR